MLLKKTGLLFIVLLSFAVGCQAAADKSSATSKVLTLEIVAPEPLTNLKANQKPNPIYLQFTNNNGSPPIYSNPVYPGDTKPVELKITAIDRNGAQVQFVSGNTGAIQPLSFLYVFSGQRLTCLIDKNAKIQIDYNVANKLLEVQGLPADC